MTGGGAFTAFLERVLPGIEQAIAQSLPQAADDACAPDLEQYLYEPLARLVRAGGKRIRPALCLLGCTAVGGHAEDALSTACSIEIFQAAALIHDDIADQSELRRGRPCLHVSDGEGIAINAGDMGVIDVVAQVMHDQSLPVDVRMSLFDELYAMERHTLEGQALDLGWVRDERWDLLEEDYLAMATLKTAHYSAASPLVLGAICGHATQEQIETLREYGLAAGLAFQIQDDLLNLVGDAGKQGKDFRSDVTEGKRTLVMVRALRQLSEADATELRSILSSHLADEGARARAVELAERSGAIAYARDYAQSLAEKAKLRVADAPISDDARTILLSMADFFVSRAN